jgi:hypothetical protein
MSTLAIVLIAIAVVVLLLVLGGIYVAGKRAREGEDAYRRHLAGADQALEAARASDRGWDRDVMEDVARAALNEHRPGWDFRSLDLVLVEDRPGVDEDHAQFEARDDSERVRVLLARDQSGWTAERVG